MHTGVIGPRVTVPVNPVVGVPSPVAHAASAKTTDAVSKPRRYVIVFLRSRPLRNSVSVAVGEGAGDEEHHVDHHPDSESADGDQLNDPARSSSEIETVRTAPAEQAAENDGRKQSLFAHARHPGIGLHGAAVRT